MSKRKRVKKGYFYYKVMGVLSKTPPNVSPTSFVINGSCYEEWLIGNMKKKIVKKGKACGTIIPEDHLGLKKFLEKLPLGTKVIFEELAKRDGDKLFSRSFSIKTLRN